MQPSLPSQASHLLVHIVHCVYHNPHPRFLLDLPLIVSSIVKVDMCNRVRVVVREGNVGENGTVVATKSRSVLRRRARPKFACRASHDGSAASRRAHALALFTTSIASATAPLLFEDPSVENRPPHYLCPFALCALCATYISFYSCFTSCERSNSSARTPPRPPAIRLTTHHQAIAIHQQQPWVFQSSSDGCPSAIRASRSLLPKTASPSSTVSMFVVATQYSSDSADNV